MRQELKIKNWGIKRWKQEAWYWFSNYIRLKYSDSTGHCNCYTCGKRMYFKDAQAGHFTAGRSNSILLDERQVRTQCYVCNCMKHGEQHEFGERLRKEIGEEEFKKVKQDKHKIKKISKKEWIDYASYYQFEAIKLANEKCLII